MSVSRENGLQKCKVRSLAVSGRSPWRIRESYLYAHIPGSGRRPREVLGDDDVEWPFVLQVEIDADTLIRVVELVCSRPPIPMPAFLRMVPAAPMPISSG